jgi:hypothetical protein
MNGKQLHRVAGQVTEWLWHQQFNRTHSRAAGLRGDPERLRLILGVDNSGVGWVAAQLTEIAPRVPFYNEPLFRIEPKLRLAPGADHTAVPYCPELPPRHPILRIYRSLVESETPKGGLELDNRPSKRPLDPDRCLIKETHALLSSEAILRGIGCRILFVHGDPARVADRQLSHEDLEGGYLALEQRAIRRPEFLRRFVPNEFRDVYRVMKRIRRATAGREQILLETVLTVALIGRMFHVLAAKYPENAMVARYESLSRSPAELVTVAVHLLGEPSRYKAGQVAGKNQTEPDDSPGAERVSVAEAASRTKRVFENLAPHEVKCCREMLTDCGLNDESPAADADAETAAHVSCRYLLYRNERG